MPTGSYKCPNCGAGLVFDPDIQKNKCEYCGSEFTDAELAQISEALEKKGEAAALADNSQAQPALSTKTAKTGEAGTPSPLKGYICDNCGAEVVTDATTSATFCYYCHSPVLLTDRLTGDFRPTRIIPFSFDREQAIGKFLSWAKSKRFVPKSFYGAPQLEKITGLYLPYWMADAAATVDYAGKGVIRRTWVSGYTEFTETKEYRIERQGTIDVNHINELANRKFSRAMLDSITPFEESSAIDFSMTYLGGFLAEKYDISRDEAEPQVTGRARDYARSMMQETISGYQQVEMDRSDLDVSIKDWQYALFPVWMLTYQYQGKTYVYAMNGQSGKSFGELPVDKPKLRLVSGMIAVGLFILAIAGGLLLW
jgi:DNA-directed RNA polymerase subunit RPC12/RpoP